MNVLTNLDIDKAGNLRISLTEAGRTVAEEMQAADTLNTDEQLAELLEFHLANYWNWVKPEDIGALTAAPILEHDGQVYWHERYQIEDPIETMLRSGYVTFERAAEE